MVPICSQELPSLNVSTDAPWLISTTNVHAASPDRRLLRDPDALHYGLQKVAAPSIMHLENLRK